MPTPKLPQPVARDLFDDSTMTFGEHLEVLRVHLLKAMAWLLLAVCVTLVFGDSIVRFVSAPINEALVEYGLQGSDIVQDDISGFDFWRWIKVQAGFRVTPLTKAAAPEEAAQPPNTIAVEVAPSELAGLLHRSDPDRYPAVEAKADEKPLVLHLTSELFAQFKNTVDRSLKPVTLQVQEAFMTYLKVAIVAGFVLASPMICREIWLFVAAGLYPHERKYVRVYLPVSLGLFLGGAVFCFYLVFPFVLDFLLGFNRRLGIVPQIRLSEWISFALLLPVMFGLSFQLPLVMLFLERIQVFDEKTYRERRRMSILVIAVVSMLLTPADPASMLLMMFPLILLYEVGIWMCTLRPASPSPFGEPA